MEKLIKNAQELFMTHPSIDTLFLATDGTGYGSLMEAQGHASQLTLNGVYRFKAGNTEGELVSGRGFEVLEDEVEETPVENAPAPSAQDEVEETPVEDAPVVEPPVVDAPAPSAPAKPKTSKK